MSRYPTLHLKPKSGRRARAGAPWIFSNEILLDAKAKSLPKGALVDVLGADGHVFGTGYFNPASLIAVRLLDGQPDAVIDSDFFALRIQQALAWRARVTDSPFYRLINAEGDGLPGLIVDRFADTLVVQIATAGMEALLEPLLQALESVLHPKAVLLRADSPARALEGLDRYVRVHKGSVGPMVVEENGVSYRTDLGAGQKTGWYYDLREARAFLAGLAKGASVLDAYCYCGGFSLAAGKAGATETLGVDSSAPAIALATQTAEALRLPCRFIETDALQCLERMGGEGKRFDIVIADPPPFVKARKDLEAGARAYRKLAKFAAAAVNPQGILFLASCSHNMPADRFAAECAEGIAKAGRAARLVRYGGAGFDHPTHPHLPESAYLKWLVYAVQ